MAILLCVKEFVNLPWLTANSFCSSVGDVRHILICSSVRHRLHPSGKYVSQNLLSAFNELICVDLFLIRHALTRFVFTSFISHIDTLQFVHYIDLTISRSIWSFCSLIHSLFILTQKLLVPILYSSCQETTINNTFTSHTFIALLAATQLNYRF